MTFLRQDETRTLMTLIHQEIHTRRVFTPEEILKTNKRIVLPAPDGLLGTKGDNNCLKKKII